MSAGDQVLHDLVDVVLAEDLAGVLGRSRVEVGGPDLDAERDERRLVIPLGGGDELVLRAVPRRFPCSWALSRPPVLLTSPGGDRRHLSAGEVLAALARLVPGDWPGLPAVLDDLRAAPERARVAATTTAAAVATVGANGSLLDWERLASLRDRPFHPTARVRHGWGPADHDRYGPELARSFGLDWVAVSRDHLERGGRGPEPADPAAGLLSMDEAAALALAWEAAGLDPAEHVAVPVHPWSGAHRLATALEAAAGTGACRPLALGLGSFVATSSVRTLAPRHGGNGHVKVALPVDCLGASRLLSARHLRNGVTGERLLRAVVAGNAHLGHRLALCDETSWCAFSAPGVDEHTAGQLGCLLRRYPSERAGEPATTLVPLSALGVVAPDGSAPALSHLLAARGSDASAADALDLVTDVALLLADVALHCFAAGVMPELHGQNVVLVARAGRLERVVLRDHDAVRVHLPWLRCSGIDEPGYLVDPRTPNTLLNETPEDLLAWFQTLAVEVAVRAVVEAATTGFGVRETDAWSAVAGALATCVGDSALPRAAREVSARQLLEAPAWPTKLVLGPLLERSGPGSASMPSGRGRGPSPLGGLDRMSGARCRPAPTPAAAGTAVG